MKSSKKLLAVLIPIMAIVIVAGIIIVPNLLKDNGVPTGTSSVAEDTSGSVNSADDSSGNTSEVESSDDSSDNNSKVESSADADVDIEAFRQLIRSLTLKPEEFQSKDIDLGDQDDFEDTFSLEVRSDKNGTSGRVSRDWTIYSSEYMRSKMTASEQKYYDRLNEVALQYINADIDAIYNSRHDVYTTNPVTYSDLGLTKSRATTIACWFRFSNPQYYFLRNMTMSNSSSIYLCLYSFAEDGNKRMEITEKVFDVVDKWVASVTDDEVTTYQKELSAYKLVCETLEYVHGDYDQSLYSSAIQNKTVCAGYAHAFSIIMNAAGIDTVVALSNSHAWNVITLDNGKSYAVDATWDDGNKKYKFFNVSEKGIKKYDTDGEHVYEAGYDKFVPALASSNYIPTEYDMTGSTSPSESEVKLTKPENFKVKYNEDSTISVSWDKVASASDYQIEAYYGTNKFGETEGPNAAVKISNAKADSEITLKVRARVQKNGEWVNSGWSEFTFSTNDPDEVKISLTAPTNYAVKFNDDTSISITWDKVTSATGYELEAYYDDNSLIGTVNLDAAAARFRNVAADREIIVKVRAIATADDKTFYSSWSEYKFSTNDPRKPEMPEGFSVKYNEGYLSVYWNKSEKATGYECESFWDSRQLDTLETTNASISLKGNITSDHNVKIRVRAIAEADGNKYYSDWAEYSFVTSVDAGISLAVPNGITHKMNEDDSISVSWDKVDSAEKYQYEIYEGDKLLGSKEITSCAIKLTGRTLDRNLTVKVRAIAEKDGKTYYSDWGTYFFSTAQVGNDSADGKTLVAVSNVTTEKVDDKSIRVKWDKVEGATGYFFEMYRDKDCTDLINSVTAHSASVKINGVSKGTELYVKICPIKDNSTEGYTWKKVRVVA